MVLNIFKMSARTKKITAIVIVVFFMLAFIMPFIFELVAGAAPNDLQQKKQQTQQQINQIKNENKNILAEKKKADDVIKGIESNIDVINDNIAQDDARLEVLQADLIKATNDANTQYDTLKKRIMVMYEQGADNYLEVLLSSGSISDFLYRFEIIKQITQYDNNRLVKLRDAAQKIEIATYELEQVKASKSAKLASYQTEKDNLDREQKKRDALVDENNMELKQLEKTLKEVEALEAKQKAEAAAKMSKNTKFVGGAMEWPSPGYYTITSPFGSRFHPILKINRMHNGVDVAAPSGAKVVAANAGTVIRSAYSSSYGNYIIIDHGGGVATLYAHGSALLVNEGAKVKRGDQIMKVGSTGYSTGPHLHYEIIVNGKNVNPMSYY